MKIVRNGLLVLGALLGIVVPVSAKPTRVRVLRNADKTRIKIVIDDYHPADAQDDVRRSELVDQLRLLGKDCLCMMESCSSEMFRLHRPQLDWSLVKFFLDDLDDYLKKQGLECVICNAECRRSVKDASFAGSIVHVNTVMREIEAYNNEEYDGYYARGLRRMRNNETMILREAMQQSLERQVGELSDIGFMRSVRSFWPFVFGESCTNLYSSFWHAELLDMKMLHAAFQENKKYTVMLCGAVHADNIVLVLKKNGWECVFNRGVEVVTPVYAENKAIINIDAVLTTLEQVQSIDLSLKDVFEEFYGQYPEWNPRKSNDDTMIKQSALPLAAAFAGWQWNDAVRYRPQSNKHSSSRSSYASSAYAMHARCGARKSLNTNGIGWLGRMGQAAMRILKR